MKDDFFVTSKDKNTKNTKESVAQEPSFLPPAEMAVKEDLNNPDIKPKVTPTKPKGFMAKLKSINLTKKQKMIGAVVAVLLLVAGVTSYLVFFKKEPVQPQPVASAPAKEEPPKPTTEASTLTGIQVQPELNKRAVTGIMIENSSDARPQSGLLEAGVVFEAIAEGGITRFLALFQESQPAYIGPVRSARPYYIDWLLGFDAAYAHAGGSGEALALIQSEGVKDMNHTASAFFRVGSRYAPHNLYTDMPKLDALRASKGYNSSTFTGFDRKAKEEPVNPPSITIIDIKPSSAIYNVHYDYAQATNSYNRVLANKPHTDEKSGKQISPKVVIVMVIPYSISGDRIHSVYQTIGSGKAYIFQDGKLTEATWAKTARKSQITFKDAAGASVKLNPGQTWLTAIGDSGKVSYSGPPAGP